MNHLMGQKVRPDLDFYQDLSLLDPDNFQVQSETQVEFLFPVIPVDHEDNDVLSPHLQHNPSRYPT
jgi:hypothetical protein